MCWTTTTGIPACRERDMNTRLGQLPDGSIILPAYLGQLDIQDSGMADVNLGSLLEDKRVEFDSHKKLYGEDGHTPGAYEPRSRQSET